MLGDVARALNPRFSLSSCGVVVGSAGCFIEGRSPFSWLGDGVWTDRCVSGSKLCVLSCIFCGSNLTKM